MAIIKVVEKKIFIGIKELSEYLDIKANTLYSWVSMRKIPYIKMGRLVRFDLKEIDKWIDKKRVEVFRLRGGGR